MTSLIQQHSITIEGTPHVITVTAQSTTNDINGNPYYLFQVWTTTNNGVIWYPKLKGFKTRKDQSYKVQSFNLNKSFEIFVSYFEFEMNNSNE